MPEIGHNPFGSILYFHHCATHLRPWHAGQCLGTVSISLRRNSLPVFRAIGLDFVSGERVVKKELLGEVLEKNRGLPRFGVEVYMNRRIIAQQLTIAVVRWPQVSQSRKTEKLGYWKGIRAEWRMIADLLNVVYPRVLLSQTWRLISLQANRRGGGQTGVPDHQFRVCAVREGIARG